MAPQSLGQIVYLFKDNRSSERKRTNCHTVAVANQLKKEALSSVPASAFRPEPSPARFKKAFLARTKRAREAAGLTQEEMARRMGIRQDKYAKYESRSPLPHQYIARFCEVTGEKFEVLFRETP
jgi:DNA-binding XRE family transcriptional regulator